MRRRLFSPTTAIGALIVLPLIACETKKSENPLSPSVAGPIPGVEISAPALVEPSMGSRFKDSQQPLRLMVQNASSNGVRPLYYTFEVASDSGFGNRVFARSSVTPGDGGRTGVQIDRLELGKTYYWRARAEDGANTGPFVTASFEVLPRPFLSPPTPLSPANNEIASSRRPELRVRNVEKNAAVGGLVYEFQVSSNQAFTQVTGLAQTYEGNGDTVVALSGDLPANATQYWRARAFDSETMGDWSGVQVFRTPAGSSGGGGTPPPGGGGGSCASNNGPAIVACIAAKYPDRLRAGVSHGERIANMEFLRDRVIEAGICGGLDLAWNLKRGVGPHSIDALAWRVNGRDEVVDIGVAYDDASIPLQLSWGIVAGPPGYDPYPRPSCQ